MRRDLLLTLTLVSFVGCAASGDRWNPFVSQSSPQTPADQTPAAQLAENPATPDQSETPGFSFSKMFQMAGFQKPETPAPSLVPQEVVKLGSMISTVTAKSAELNANDPPEVTRQKAQAILVSLQGWDSALAASRSTGAISNDMAQTMDGWVGQLRGEAEKLVKYVPNPDTIAGIQQLAGSLNSTFGNVSSMINQGSAVSQAIRGTNRS